MRGNSDKDEAEVSLHKFADAYNLGHSHKDHLSISSNSKNDNSILQSKFVDVKCSSSIKNFD